MASTTTLRPLRVGEILDVAIKIFLRNWRTLCGVVLVVVVPVQVLDVLVRLSLTPDVQVTHDVLGRPQIASGAIDSGGQVAGQLVVGLLGVVATTLATAACFKAVSDAYVGERSTWREALGVALRRGPSVLWVTFLFSVGVTLGFLALVVGSIYLWVAWSVAVPALLFEGLRGTKALGRSRRLVRGRWWPTFGALLVGYLLAAVVGGVVQALVLAPTVALAGSATTTAIVAAAIAGALGQVVSRPIQAAIVTVVYFDLRVRKEGFDLQLLAEGLGFAAPSADSDVLPPTLGPGGGDGAGDGEQPPYWPPPPGWRPRSERLAESPEASSGA